MNLLTITLTVISGLSFIGYGISCLISEHMRAEFRRFGLARFRTTVGVLELLGGCAQLGSLVFLPVGPLAAGGLTVLMGAGVLTRIRCGDGLLVSLPAIGYLLLNACLLYALLTQ